MIRIDIDPAIIAGYIHDRYDLLVRGRVVSDVPVEEVTVRLDDAVVGRVQYGPTDLMAQDGPADGDGDTQYVFRVNLQLRRAQAHRMCTFTIGARTQHGDTYEDSFDLSVDPSNSMPISVASGPTRSSAKYARVWAPVVLYVERAALDDSGQVLVLGWAVSLAAMVTVQVFLNEERIGDARNSAGSAMTWGRPIRLMRMRACRASHFRSASKIATADVSTVRVPGRSV